MSRWTHNVCADCWNTQHPESSMADNRRGQGLADVCCFCSHKNTDGVYLRLDPQDPTLVCGGFHLQDDPAEPEFTPRPFDDDEDRELVAEFIGVGIESLLVQTVTTSVVHMMLNSGEPIGEGTPEDYLGIMVECEGRYNNTSMPGSFRMVLQFDAASILMKNLFHSVGFVLGKIQEKDDQS